MNNKTNVKSNNNRMNSNNSKENVDLKANNKNHHNNTIIDNANNISKLCYSSIVYEPSTA